MSRFLAIMLLLSSTHLFSQDCNYSIDTIQVKSDILTEDRSIIIFKPLNFSGADSVQLIYLIDGEFSIGRFQQISERLKDSVSDFIAVGIVNTDRKRDLLYAHAADKFLDFITTELIPVVERGYKIRNRILFGHSFGGGFTILQ
jgi:predicted alpha/beta superfamily hydrolase